MRVYQLPSIERCSVAAIDDRRQIGMIASGPALRAARQHGLALQPAWQAEPGLATEPGFAALAAACPAAIEVIYAVGGGLAVDAAKYVAHQRGLPLIAIPTALSVDAHLTWASGVRQDGCVVYLPTGAPSLLYADMQLIAAAPAHVRAAGVCDLLSIATGLWDWRVAEEHGMNPEQQRWLLWADRQAQAILEATLDVAAAAGAGDPEGLWALLSLLALEVQLCNQIGHSRPEEGSEHYLAYALEAHPAIGAGHAHGDLVGPAILAIAAAQGQPTASLRAGLLAAGVPLDRVSPAVIDEVSATLPLYVRRHQLPYGIADWIGQER
jgi:glycerol-1-phosphate dehydrogenase [NAD(P)+]